MYASTIGDILVKFAYRFQPAPSVEQQTSTSTSSDQADANKEETKDSTPTRPKAIQSLSILGDVTYGACCIDDLSARALGCDLLVHYGHSCLVPLTCTVIPCLYVFVEIRVDVQHMIDCVHMTFLQEEKERRQDKSQEGSDNDGPARIIEACVLGTVQFRSAVIEAAQRLNSEAGSSISSSDGDEIKFQAIVPQAKPLSPGETLGCTAPSGLAQLDFQDALLSPRERRERKKQAAAAAAASGADGFIPEGLTDSIPRERVMLFLADGRFHLEAAMISNPTLRALRYDPYSKTLTEERYETVKMKRLRREAIMAVRKSLGVSDPLQRRVTSSVQDGDDIANSVLQPQQQQRVSSSRPPSSANRKTMGIILGTLGRQGNPAILSRLRSLLHSRGIQTIIVLLSEIFPKKLEMLSKPTSSGGSGVCAWVQVACPRLSIDWGHYFCVPVLSPFELYVAFGEVESAALWVAEEEKSGEPVDDLTDQYPMDFYTKSGGPWTNYYDSNTKRQVLSYGV